MIPYLGCKKRIANELLANIPPAEHFYDLFGGGGSVTEAAYKYPESLFCEGKKWKQVHYNELATSIYELVRCMSNADNSKKIIKEIYFNPITKQTFRNLESVAAVNTLAKLVYGYNLRADSYLWNEESERYKIGLIKKLTEEIKLNNIGIENFRKFRVAWLKKNNCIITIKDKRSPKGERNKIEFLQPLERLDSINFDELKCSFSNKDYREVKIEPNSVVYCDIPYPGSSFDYGVSFDHFTFYEWVKTCEFPVFFSSYEAPATFQSVWKSPAKGGISRKYAKCRSENLFWNGVKNG